MIRLVEPDFAGEPGLIMCVKPANGTSVLHAVPSSVFYVWFSSLGFYGPFHRSELKPMF